MWARSIKPSINRPVRISLFPFTTRPPVVGEPESVLAADRRFAPELACPSLYAVDRFRQSCSAIAGFASTSDRCKKVPGGDRCGLRDAPMGCESVPRRQSWRRRRVSVHIAYRESAEEIVRVLLCFFDPLRGNWPTMPVSEPAREQSSPRPSCINRSHCPIVTCSTSHCCSRAGHLPSWWVPRWRRPRRILQSGARRPATSKMLTARDDVGANGDQMCGWRPIADGPYSGPRPAPQIRLPSADCRPIRRRPAVLSWQSMLLG